MEHSQDNISAGAECFFSLGKKKAISRSVHDRPFVSRSPHDHPVVVFVVVVVVLLLLLLLLLDFVPIRAVKQLRN